MARDKLTALKVERTKRPGRYADGAGLYLQVTSKTSRSWVFRYRLDGHLSKKREDGGGGKPLSREMGLGSAFDMTLAEAREEATRCRKLVKDGIDPIEAKREARHQVEIERDKTKTFKQSAEAYIDAHDVEWRHFQHRKQWKNTLKRYVYPALGNIPVRTIDVTHVLGVLRPIWAKKPVTAKRVQNRIENVLDWARAHGYREGENPARWRGHLDHLLAAPSKIHKKRPFPSLPYTQVAEFLAALRPRQGIAARGLQYLILTGMRSGDLIGQKREERPPLLGEHIDLAARLWTIPATKNDSEHIVPLSDAAMAVLSEMSPEPGEPVFPDNRGGGPLTASAMTAVIKRMIKERKRAGLPLWVDPKQGGRGITVHGFRATFRTWAAEQTHFPRDLLEKAIAHKVGDETSRAYDRGELLAKRKRLMDAWAAYCSKVSEPVGNNVTQLRRAGGVS